jgi:hypothetical protein
MVEPVSMAVLGVLVSEFAKGTVEAWLERRDSPPLGPQRPMALSRQEPVSIIDLTSARSPTVRATVTLSARTAWGSPPYWALFGVQSADRQMRVIPVLYGEPVELRVARGEYDLSALFLTEPTSFYVKPYLVAYGTAHKVLASSRVQPVALSGSPPTTLELTLLKFKLSMNDLPFQIHSPALPASPSPLGLSGRQASRPAFPRSQLGGFAKPIAPMGMKGFNRFICLARNASGQLCGKPTMGWERNRLLCTDHVLAVRLGKDVVWHSSGQPIRLNLEVT